MTKPPEPWISEDDWRRAQEIAEFRHLRSKRGRKRDVVDRHHVTDDHEVVLDRRPWFHSDDELTTLLFSLIEHEHGLEEAQRIWSFWRDDPEVSDPLHGRAKFRAARDEARRQLEAERVSERV